MPPTVPLLLRPSSSRPGVVRAVVLALCLVGCKDEKRRAWEPEPGEEPPPAASGSAWPVIEPPNPSATASAIAPPASPLPADSAGINDPDAAGAPLGGMWITCYGGFKPSSTPTRDVTRLALLCGPPTGMRPIESAAVSGALKAGAPPLTASFRAPAGSCFRVFAVGDRGVEDLDVAIKSSRGKRVAADLTQDRWPIVYPDRPACTLEEDTFEVEITVARGEGEAAAEVWLLPPAG